MSSEWPHVKLGSLADFQEGYVNPSQREPSYFDGPVKWLRATDLNDGLVTNTSRTLSDKGFNSAGKSAVLFKPGSLAISKSGTIGRLGLLGDHMCGNRAVINIKPKPNSVPRYLFFVLRHLRPTIETLAEGSVQKNLYVSVLSSLDVPAPPKELQQAIADILGVLDDRITLLRETNNTLEAVAQALFKSWFVDFDPVHAKMQGRPPEGMDAATADLFPYSFEEPVLGSVPKGWSVGNLNALAELNPESWSAKHHPERVLYVDLANTKAGQIDECIEFSFEDAPSRARRALRCGDVIVGTVRPGNRSFARIASDVTGLTGSTGFAVLRAREVADQAMVYVAATNNEAIDRLSHLADGGAYPAVRPEVVGTTPLVVAPEEIRNSFGEIANPLFASIGLNQERMRQLGSLRDTLLPRLTSGQHRLPDTQAIVASLA